jgi:hypothetical protein
MDMIVDSSICAGVISAVLVFLTVPSDVAVICPTMYYVLDTVERPDPCITHPTLTVAPLPPRHSFSTSTAPLARRRPFLPALDALCVCTQPTQPLFSPYCLRSLFGLSVACLRCLCCLRCLRACPLFEWHISRLCTYKLAVISRRIAKEQSTS